MEYLLLIARLVLAVTFLVSSIGKFLDLKGSNKAMRDFGVPDSACRSGGHRPCPLSS